MCSPGSEYAHLLNEAVEYAFSSVESEEKCVVQRTELALDYLVSVKAKETPVTGVSDRVQAECRSSHVFLFFSPTTIYRQRIVLIGNVL